MKRYSVADMRRKRKKCKRHKWGVYGMRSPRGTLLIAFRCRKCGIYGGI